MTSIAIWIIGGLLIAVALIVYAIVRAGSGVDDFDPYNGDGF